MDMVEYTTVDRADTLVPLFYQRSAPVCSQDVVTPDHSLLTVLDWPMLHKIMLLNMLYRREQLSMACCVRWVRSLPRLCCLASFYTIAWKTSSSGRLVS